MPKMLVDEGTEYDDATPATESQQAKVTQQPEQLWCHARKLQTPAKKAPCSTTASTEFWKNTGLVFGSSQHL